MQPETLAILRVAYEAARAHRSADGITATKLTWNAMERLTPRRKVSSFACRAGRRQYRERLALQQRRSR